MTKRMGERMGAGAAMLVSVSPVLAQAPEVGDAPAHAETQTVPQPADGVPGPVRAMLEAAARTEDAAQVAAVAYAASEVYPDDADAINEYGDFLRAVISPLSGLSIETVLVQAEPAVVEPVPVPEVRTAEQQIEAAPAPKFLDLGDWTGRVSASGLIASGNSENAAAGLVVEANLPDGDFTHQLRSYFDYGRSRGTKTQQRWGGSYKLDYAIDDDTFAYGRFSYDEDEFSGFDYRLFAGLGAGHWLLRNESLALKVEGGPGFRYAPIDDTREVDSHFAFYAATELDWIIRDGLKFEQDANATWSDPTSTVISTSTITAAFTDTLSTGFSYMVRYETDPPVGRLRLDRTFRANLTYGF